MDTVADFVPTNEWIYRNQRDGFYCPNPTWTSEWVFCRDYAMQRMMNHYEGYIYYKFPVNKVPQRDELEGCKNIERWFYYIEGRMGWSDRSKFCLLCGIPNCIKIFPSPKWRQNLTSLSLLTLMIRVGLQCTPERSLEEVLHYDKYTNLTKSAIHRFLQGHQHYAGRFETTRDTWTEGWIYKFIDRDRNGTSYEKGWDVICRLLIDRKQVEEYAYYEWEKAGKPEGRGNEFWEIACNKFKVSL